ncbi:MAG: ABC transporter permease [Sphingomonadales bacterium]
MSYLRLLVKNLGRKKLRTSLTIFSIFVAFLIFGVLTAFKDALNAGVELAGANRLVTVNKISFIQPLPMAYYNKIKALKGVRSATFASWFGGYYQDPRQVFPSFSVDPATYLDVYPELYMPSDQRQRWLNNRRGALVGEGLATRFGWKVGDTIPITSNIWIQKNGSQTWEFTIDGIFAGKDEKIDTTYLLFHYDYFNEARSFGRDNLGWIVIAVVDPALNESVAAAIDAQFDNAPAETKTSTEKAFNQAFIEQFGNISFVVASVVSAAFFTILLIAGNTMMLALRERTNEIAVMKALGFQNPAIFGLVLAESLLLALVGGLPGTAAAWLIVEGIRDSVGGFLPTIVVTAGIAAQALGVMVLLGVLTGALPAFSAIRVSVVTALGRR